MPNQDNLPIKAAAQNVAAPTDKSGSLVGRGLMALRKNNDALYRQARDVYDRLTDYGHMSWAGYPERIAPLTEAFNTFRQLSANGYGKAYYPLSTFYFGEQGLEEDQTLAEQFHKLAYEWCFANQTQEDPEIWHDLGALYLGENNELAINWFQKAADAGHAGSMWVLSSAYEIGVGFEQDWEKSLYWQIKAAEAGIEEAQNGLKIQHEHGDLELKIDDEQVFDWYIWSAKHGHVWAQLFLGDAYLDGDKLGQDDKQSMYWYQKAAEQGDKLGQVHLGIGYRDGRGIEQNDGQAVFWLRKAAEQGSQYGQVNLGVMYGDGRGVVKDDEQAVYWVRKAAEQGDACGQSNLGGMYQFGRGVEKDAYQGYLWLLKSAEQGYAVGQYWLASAYEHGRGVAPDAEQANYWYRKAAEQGNEQAAYWLRKASEHGDKQSMKPLLSKELEKKLSLMPMDKRKEYLTIMAAQVAKRLAQRKKP